MFLTWNSNPASLKLLGGFDHSRENLTFCFQPYAFYNNVRCLVSECKRDGNEKLCRTYVRVCVWKKDICAKSVVSHSQKQKKEKKGKNFVVA